MRDVATEVVMEARPKSYQSLNPPEVPYILFSSHAGGKIYNVCTDHITDHVNGNGRAIIVVENARHLLF